MGFFSCLILVFIMTPYQCKTFSNGSFTISDPSFVLQRDNIFVLCPAGEGKWKLSIAWTYQVVLQWVGPDIVLDDLAQLVGSCIRVLCEPGEETLRLIMLPLLPTLIGGGLARTLGQILRRTVSTTNDFIISVGFCCSAVMRLNI